jgi:hypothetical protein
MSLISCNARAVLCSLVLLSGARADTSAFDLNGPSIEVRVTHNGKTLPVAEVPNLEAGDRVWLNPKLPPGETVHYLLIAAFLRGPANPPPDAWFIKVETWRKAVREEGVVVTVPAQAQQALIFLAPETMGDFKTLRAAVENKPGAFVRVSQDLNEASFDRMRLDKYLASVREASAVSPAELHERSVLLARSLGMKLDEQCFDKPAEQQASCLTHGMDDLVLNDPRSTSMVAALTSGSASDLIGQMTATPMARGGYYSPYVGAFMDIARLMDGLRTASYQYIPALALPTDNRLDLRLNNPPSFQKPKSVLVAALPPVGNAQIPPLRAVDPKQVVCLEKPEFVLPAEGAPLVFATSLGHAFHLRVADKSGKTIDLSATPDAARGGFRVDTSKIDLGALDAKIEGKLEGNWGFQSYDGPAYRLLSGDPAWTISPHDRAALVAGRDAVVHLESAFAACTADVSIKGVSDKKDKPTWKLLQPDDLEVRLALKDVKPGPLTLLLKRTGGNHTDEVQTEVYYEPGRLARFEISAGDRRGTLEGTHLDEVTAVKLGGVRFLPMQLLHGGESEELTVSTHDAPTAALAPDKHLVAQVDLKDGRTLDLQTTVEPERPKVRLISRNIDRGAAHSAIRLTAPEELPQDSHLVFFIKTQAPETFSRKEKIEVAAEDNSFQTMLTIADGRLTLQDSHTILAQLDPLKAFGNSAFGPLRFRAIAGNGARSDWQPLAMLVRLPLLKEIRCPFDVSQLCQLAGGNLFLIDSVSADSAFTKPVTVPEGFADDTLKVPRPVGTVIYIKLRDDPAAISAAALPVLPE